MKHRFEITVRVAGHEETPAVNLAFDPDDIYDAALASEVRAIARRALVMAGKRDTADLK